MTSIWKILFPTGIHIEIDLFHLIECKVARSLLTCSRSQTSLRSRWRAFLSRAASSRCTLFCRTSLFLKKLCVAQLLGKLCRNLTSGQKLSCCRALGERCHWCESWATRQIRTRSCTHLNQAISWWKLLSKGLNPDFCWKGKNWRKHFGIELCNLAWSRWPQFDCFEERYQWLSGRSTFHACDLSKF